MFINFNFFTDSIQFYGNFVCYIIFWIMLLLLSLLVARQYDGFVNTFVLEIYVFLPFSFHTGYCWILAYMFVCLSSCLLTQFNFIYKDLGKQNKLAVSVCLLCMTLELFQIAWKVSSLDQVEYLNRFCCLQFICWKFSSW